MAPAGLIDVIYNILIILTAMIVFPLWIFQLVLKGRSPLRHFSGINREEQEKLRGKRVLWIQAVSVGEVSAMIPFLKAWRSGRPDWAILLTTTTATGQAYARQWAAPHVDVIGYFPLDLPPVIRRLLKRANPQVFLMAESEIWPNFLRIAKKQGIWTGVINARISDRSYKKYFRIKGILGPIWQRIDRFCVQTALDAERISSLGVPSDKIIVTGNIKFDISYPEISDEARQAFLRSLGWNQGQKIFTAASTHQGEEELLIKVFLALREKYPCRLLLAPRHPHRRDEVEKLLAGAGLSWTLRSCPEEDGTDRDVLLLDTFGELALAYAAGELVFVGGSLVPVGGHNILEAAAQHKAVVYGQHMHNFREIEAIFRQAGAGLLAADEEELKNVTADCWNHPEHWQAMGETAFQLLRKHEGATKATLDQIPEGGARE